MEIGLGQMGMSPEEFDAITVAEFTSKQRGFFELEKQRERQQWHRTIALINIQLPRGKKIDPDSLFREKKLPRLMTKKEFDELTEKLKHYHVTGKSKLLIPG